jgi:hypothetical protein
VLKRFGQRRGCGRISRRAASQSKVMPKRRCDAHVSVELAPIERADLPLDARPGACAFHTRLPAIGRSARIVIRIDVSLHESFEFPGFPSLEAFN